MTLHAKHTKASHGKTSHGKTKSKRQVGFLLDGGSPLSAKQQAKLKRELHAGRVKVRK